MVSGVSSGHIWWTWFMLIQTIQQRGHCHLQGSPLNIFVCFLDFFKMPFQNILGDIHQSPPHFSSRQNMLGWLLSSPWGHSPTTSKPLSYVFPWERFKLRKKGFLRMPEIEQCHCKTETSSFKTTNIHFKIVTKNINRLPSVYGLQF